MPTSLNESWKQSQSPNKSPTINSDAANGIDSAGKSLPKPGGVKIPLGSWALTIEPRYFVIASLIIPLYVFACFVGNDWGYMLPCTLFAALIVGTILPLIEVGSICFSCRIPPKTAVASDQEILLKAWRLPFFGLLSRLIPSGYLNARLHLTRRGWTGSKKVPAELPLPVVLQSLSQGLEMRIRTPTLGRGVYEVDSVEVSSCFPFAFVWWSRKIDLDSAKESGCITVLPALKEISGNFHSRLSTNTANVGRSQRSWMMQHRSTNFKGLREFTERDSLNQIHWSSSARSGKFLVREFEVESLPDYDVTIDLRQSWNDQQFDLACSCAFALIHYGNRMGFSPQLVLNPHPDWEPLSILLSDIPPGLTGEELASEMLARLSPMPDDLNLAYSQRDQDLERSNSVIHAELAKSSRPMVSLSPVDPKNKKSRAIALHEKLSGYSQSDDLENGTPTSAASQQIMQLESEPEISRL